MTDLLTVCLLFISLSTGMSSAPCLQSVALLLVVSASARSELITGSSELQTAFALERNVVPLLSNYIEKTEEKLAKLKRYERRLTSTQRIELVGSHDLHTSSNRRVLTSRCIARRSAVPCRISSYSSILDAEYRATWQK